MSIQRALISVSDKTGLVPFARRLDALGIEILSTGGTAGTLREANIPVKDISEFTGFPEMLDGRIKTLHPKVHGGLLFLRDSEEHRETAAEHGIEPIDLVVVNLYPFRETVARPDVTREEAIEQIDIGGPCMLRSAAKNHGFVTAVCSPDLYDEVAASIEERNGDTTLELRRRLATEVYRHTAAYDAAITAYLDAQAAASGDSSNGDDCDRLPDTIAVSLPRSQKMRYGENPHQAASFYGDASPFFSRLHGKELSYNNLLDLTAAVEIVQEFSNDDAACAIIKHTNPCGVGLAGGIIEAWEKALATDPDSASGGIVALNRPVDIDSARAIHDRFTEIIAAPAYEPDALELLESKKNRILVETHADFRTGHRLRMRSLPGGMLVQEPDLSETTPDSLNIVTQKKPTDDEIAALLFAWKIVKHLKSNAIVFTGKDRSLGMGAGQMSRVDAALVAVMKARNAGLDLAGSVVASDAFFPFPDGLQVCAEAGAKAVIQPGGSRRDDEVIAAANDKGVAMVFTGERRFRH
jgi:phosphoribosylaminoimidazolecarboxamide formyltransferase/IMP cyclohydrolase